VIPRPNHFDEIYKNTEEMPIFTTNIDNLPPYTNAHYIVNETFNSSPRIIRSSFNKLPTDYNNITTSNLSFGLLLQPFAEYQNNEKEIPKVDSPEGLFRCKTCEGYLNNKFRIDFGKKNKRVAVCNLCGTDNELESTNPKVKSEYFNASSYAPELNCPTVDYIVPNNLKHKVAFIPHYIFAIDVSQISVDFGLPIYVRIIFNIRY